MQLDKPKMDAAFRANQAGYAQGYKDGRQDASANAYDEGWNDGYEVGKADATREALTRADLWEGIVDDALDLLVRHFDRTDGHVSDALREVLKDLQHPSRVWDTPKEAPDA